MQHVLRVRDSSKALQGRTEGGKKGCDAPGGQLKPSCDGVLHLLMRKPPTRLRIKAALVAVVVAVAVVVIVVDTVNVGVVVVVAVVGAVAVVLQLTRFVLMFAYVRRVS